MFKKRQLTAIEQLQKQNDKIFKANKEKMSALDRYCIFSFSVMIIYTITELITSSLTEVSHDTLTTCLYSAFGGELLLCAMIKRLKLKRGD